MNSSLINPIVYLPSPITPFSLQAATWFYVTNPLYVRQDGCQLSNGTQNCSQACADVNSIFLSGATFENCLSYSNISNSLYKYNAISLEPAIDTYGFLPNDHEGSKAIVTTVTSCLKGWANTIPSCAATNGSCTGNDYGACSALFTISAETGVFPIYDNSGGSDPFTSPTFQCINTICDYVFANAKVSADVGGIGVYISYIFQISLVMLCWLGVEYFRFLHPVFVRQFKKSKHEHAESESSGQKEIFQESTIEFHRAQCYFMSAILIAALVAAQQNGLEAGTLQQVFNNLVLLNILSIGGSIPILFMLFKLRLAGHKSWYTFILSTITLAFAIGLAFSSGPHRTLSNVPLQPDSFSIPNCGTIDPTMLCLQGYSSWQPGNGTTQGKTSTLYTENKAEYSSAIAGSLLFWTILLLDAFKILDLDRLKLTNESVNAGETGKAKAEPYKFWLRLVFGAVDLILTVGSLVLMGEYLKDLVKFGYGPTDWSFGQIVAITVWAAPLVQYLYLQLHGVEGRRWHLPATLRVTRHKESQARDFEGHQLHRWRASKSSDIKSNKIDSNSLDPQQASLIYGRSPSRSHHSQVAESES